jgi:glycosyltransferase involved in cell wall biosynthesis
LSYLCAGRAIVLSAPPENLACRIINEARAGISVPPGAQSAFVNAVLTLLSDADARVASGAAARAYAEREFDIARIYRIFEDICTAVVRDSMREW